MYLAYHNAQQAAQELHTASEQGKPWLLCVGDGLADAAAHEEWRISRKDAANSVVMLRPSVSEAQHPCLSQVFPVRLQY